MSLGLWEFFWTETDWTGTPPAPAPSPTPAPGSGHGKGKGHGKKQQYERLNEDFWDVREAYLKSIQNEFLDEAPPAPIVTAEAPTPAPPPRSNFSVIPRLVGERAAAISALRLAENVQELHARGIRLIELNRNLYEARRLESEYLKAQKRISSIEEYQKRVAKRKKSIQKLQEVGTDLLKRLIPLLRPPNT